MYGSGNIPRISSYIEVNPDNVWDIKTIEYKDNGILAEDKALIDEVVDTFSKFSSTDLLKIIFHQSPYREAYIQRSLANPFPVISVESLRTYFREEN